MMPRTAATLEQQPLSFGSNYAVLNLDWMKALIDTVKKTDEGKQFVANCRRWNDAVYHKSARPLTIFSSLHFDHGEPELASNSPFTRLVKSYGNFATDSPEVQIAPHFQVRPEDVLLQKTRWYAGEGNKLQQILKVQNIDTVVIVCYCAPQKRGNVFNFFSKCLYG